MTSQKQADSLRAQVYQQLRSALRKGQIGTGSSATERELAEHLGVSRTPVREALALLVHEGLISATSRGFSTPRLSLQDLTDLFQIRRMLEPNALVSTIEHLSPHDFRMLRQFLEEQEAADARGDVTAFVEANANFRALWLARVPNRQLRELIERHNDHVRWVRHVALEDPKVRKKILAGLRKGLAALQGGKPAAVAAALLDHLEVTEQAVAAVIAQVNHNPVETNTAKASSGPGRPARRRRAPARASSETA